MVAQTYITPFLFVLVIFTSSCIFLCSSERDISSSKQAQLCNFFQSWFVVVWRGLGMVSQHWLDTDMYDFYLSDPFAHPLPVSFIAKVNFIRKKTEQYLWKIKQMFPSLLFVLVFWRWLFQTELQNRNVLQDVWCFGRKSWGENVDLLCIAVRSQNVVFIEKQRKLHQQVLVMDLQWFCLPEMTLNSCQPTPCFNKFYECRKSSVVLLKLLIIKYTFF